MFAWAAFLKWAAVGCLAVLFLYGEGSACTLFGAAGETCVAGGGTLVAKVRDYRPGKQCLRTVCPARGHRYLGLYSTSGYNVGGVNEHGLAVMVSQASAVPRQKRGEYYRSAKGLRLNEHILRHFRSVDEALSLPERYWKGAINLLLADRVKIAVVEILPDGRHTVKALSSGTLAHTNHYLEAASRSANVRVSPSSRIRYARIEALLRDTPRPFTLETFVRFSADRNDGPDNSIWRVGSKADKPQSLAAFVVHIPPVGTPQVYVKYRERPEERGLEKLECRPLTAILDEAGTR